MVVAVAEQKREIRHVNRKQRRPPAETPIVCERHQAQSGRHRRANKHHEAEQQKDHVINGGCPGSCRQMPGESTQEFKSSSRMDNPPRQCPVLKRISVETSGVSAQAERMLVIGGVEDREMRTNKEKRDRPQRLRAYSRRPGVRSGA